MSDYEDARLIFQFDSLNYKLPQSSHFMLI